MNDDFDAIRRVLAAHVESFRRLVERYQRPLLTLIRNLTPPDTDHEGVAQEVFLAAFRSLASFDPKRSALSTWLFTIACNRCRNELARRRPVVGAELPDVVDLRSPERAASEAELFRQLDAALDALLFEQRSAFVLAPLQGLSYEEVGRMPKRHAHQSASARGWNRSVAGCRVRIMICDTCRRPSDGDCDACSCFLIDLRFKGVKQRGASGARVPPSALRTIDVELSGIWRLSRADAGGSRPNPGGFECRPR